jgi:hypothetical protein
MIRKVIAKIKFRERLKKASGNIPWTGLCLMQRGSKTISYFYHDIRGIKSEVGRYECSSFTTIQIPGNFDF